MLHTTSWLVPEGKGEKANQPTHQNEAEGADDLTDKPFDDVASLLGGAAKSSGQDR